jgi:predicted ATPase/DNA-binding winged helix-turn-helix (wHTH) protein
MNIMDAQSRWSVSRDVLCFGPFRLAASERVLEKDGVPVRIGSRALDILIALVERPAELVSKKELIAKVWPDLVVDEGSLRFHVSALRKALGQGRSGTRYVTNVSGRGYCFVAPISRTASPPAILINSLADLTVGLPPTATRLVGRDETVELIAEELIARRFLTIVGPGGIGKTTVANAVSRTMFAAFDGAVHYADFGPLETPSLVSNMVASTVGLPGNFDDALAALPAFLRDRRMLLVLDSCEHLVETIAPLAERIFREAPEVHILATSREPLQVEGEQTYRLHPLAFPPDDEPLTAAYALTFPAVQLFVERAAADGSGFELNDADAPIVGKVCRRLDGIALALELAAGRVGAYGIKGIASLLDGSCRLLWHGRRTASPRHQTLNAMLDWSYNLLPESERIILCRLSVFVGAFSLEAAQFVAAGDIQEREQIAEAIAGLVTKSLVAVETNRTGTLYRLLDTTRAYVLTKMADSSEKSTIAQRHAIYYREFLENIEIGSLTCPNGTDERWRHVSNARAALEWSFAEQGDKDVGTALAAASAPLFLELSLLTECRAWMERAIAEHGGQGDCREMELQEALAVSLMFSKGNSKEVLAALTMALSLAQVLELPYHQMRLSAAHHTFLVRTGDFHGAAAVAEQNEAVAKKTVDPMAMMMADWMLGISHHLLGDQASARKHCETALNPGQIQNSSLIRSGYDQHIRALLTLARALWLQGYASRAVTVATQALHQAIALDHPVSLCLCRIYRVTFFLWAGDWSEADRIIDKLIAYAEKYSLRCHHAISLGLKGELSLGQGDTKAGLRLLNASLDALEACQHQTMTPIFMSDLAICLARAGRPDEADAAINRAMACGEPNARPHFYLPEMLRTKGELLASGPHLSEAETWFSRSLDLAREQSALAWELRTTTSLAHLWARQGRSDEAPRVLRPVYDRFTEGFDTSDLRAAKRLLDESRLSRGGSDRIQAC